MNKQLRVSEKAAIGGVCGGIAEYFDSDPVLVRIAFCLLFLAAPITMIIVYVMMSMIMKG